MKKTVCYLLLVLAGVFFNIGFSNATELPNYQLTIDPADLAEMNAHPFDEESYPAVFRVNGTDYEVEARYKGSSSLAFPKKSWAIKFGNTDNPFNVPRINLHADYNDESAMRNFLILRLAAFLGLPAPTIEHVTYTVNGENWGVYTQTEQIDEYFLARNNRQNLALYKGSDHGANLAPLVNDELYLSVWEIEGNGDLSYNELRTLFNKFLYLPKADFDNELDNFVETDKVLSLYAILFTFVEFDNFTKNTWVNKNSNSMKYELLPWDNEGSFGNSAFGDFDSTLVSYNFDQYQHPEYALLIQRMLENPVWKNQFENKVDTILDKGYLFLDSLMDTTYVQIKDAVYLDPNKRGTNASFDEEQNRLKWFMTERKAFLETNNLPERDPLTIHSVENPLPTETNPIITIRIKSPKAQSVRVVFADSVDYKNIGEPNKLRTYSLFDDGTHNDLAAGDLIYGRDIDSRDFDSDWAQFTMLGGGQNYPANAILYTKYVRTKALALNKGNTNNNVAAQIEIDKVLGYGNNRFLRMINKSADTLDLSYCHIRTTRATDDFMFPDNSYLPANDTAYVSATTQMGQVFFPNKTVFANLYYEVDTNDSLFLLSPPLTPMDTVKVGAIENLVAGTTNIMFTEINYKSSSSFDTDDWVEIYNAGTETVDISNWIFRDGDNDHAFFIPEGTELAANAYLVLSSDTSAMNTLNTPISNMVGNFDFGLSSSGEAVRLFDNIGNLVDSVEYSSSAPWPTEPAGTGPTLELISTSSDNSLATSWFVYNGEYGTPGSTNHSAPTSVTETNTSNFSVYPNPASHIIYINTSGACTVELRSLNGIVIDRVIFTTPVKEKAVFNLESLDDGIYLIQMNSTNGVETKKVVVTK